MRKHFGDVIGLLLLGFVAACRFSPAVADFYAERCYPRISAILSWPVSWIPFSLEELVVIAFIVAFLFVLVRAIRKQEGVLRWLGRTGRIVMWLLVWFYMGWGNNYFRTPLYARLGVTPARFEQEAFERFLTDYTDLLNNSAGSPRKWVPDELERSIKDFYAGSAATCGYVPPRAWQHVKKPLINPLYTAVSILGWMGPFFCETHVNLDLPALQYPSTLAHETAHLAGVTGEGEANYWAYAFCRQSEDPLVQYSGCLTILPFVVSNARELLPPERYAAWRESLPQQALDDTEWLQLFWLEKQIPFFDRAQRWLMDLFLKSNGVSDGARNYRGVVGIIMTLDQEGI